jgi:copper transport protein
VRTLARAVALGAVVGVAALANPEAGGSIALGHSQLVSSTPGSGEVVASAPSQIVLVFSEPVDGAHTSLDLLDSKGATIATGLGAPVTSAPTTFVANVPALGEGTYTVTWQALSAADGHSTSGSFSFGVGNVAAGSLPLDVGGTGGDLHAGHDAGQILLEVQGRALSDGGFMLAFGLLSVAAVVVGPAGFVVAGIVPTQLAALAVGAVSAILLGLAAGASPGLDPVGYLTSSRSGGLLVDRALVAVVGIVVASIAARLGRRRLATVLAGTAGAIGILLIALGGHVAAADHAAPVAGVATIAVHVGAASIWLAGVAALAGLAIARPTSIRTWLPAVVPRFSALALVSVALVAGTGAYIAWLETGDLTTVDSQYAIALLAKAALVLGALVLGAVNLLGRGGPDRRVGGFERRIVIEAVILGGVLVATANLASGSPPGPERPVPLAASAPAGIAATGGSATASAIVPTLAVEPGTPGPNAWWVTVPAAAGADGIELRLDRLDRSAGAENVVRLRALPGSPGTWVATGALLPTGSRWGATVVASARGRELGRSTVAFAMGTSGLVAGRAGLAIDPGLGLAVLLVAASVLALSFALAGGRLPLVEGVAGRRALVGGGLVGACLAIVLAVGAMTR